MTEPNTMTDKPAMTIEEMSLELLRLVYKSESLNLSKRYILDVITEAYARGRRDMGEEIWSVAPRKEVEEAATEFKRGWNRGITHYLHKIRSLIEKEPTK